MANFRVFWCSKKTHPNRCVGTGKTLAGFRVSVSPVGIARLAGKGEKAEWRGYTLLRNVTAQGASKSGP
jgi:hypothetical protein